MKNIILALSLVAAAAGLWTPAARADVTLTLDLPFPFPIPGGPGHGGPGRPDRPRPPRPLPPPPHPGRPIPPPRPVDNWIFQPVRANYLGVARLPLNQILGLDRGRYSGSRIENVVLRASTAFGQGEATVLVNGYPVTAPQRVEQRPGDTYFYLPLEADELDYEISTLELELRGNFFVDGVGVQLGWARPLPPPPRPLPPPPEHRLRERIDLNQDFRNDRIRLADYVDLQRWEGYRLSRVILRGATRAGFGDATFCGSRDCNRIKDVDTVIRNNVFNQRDELVGRDTDMWTMEFNGNFYVESIIFEFK